MTEKLTLCATTLKFTWGDIKELFPQNINVDGDTSCEVDVDYTTKKVTVYQENEETPIVSVGDNLPLIDELQSISVEMGIVAN